MNDKKNQNKEPKANQLAVSKARRKLITSVIMEDLMPNTYFVLLCLMMPLISMQKT